jgi:hypothetical protein
MTGGVSGKKIRQFITPASTRLSRIGFDALDVGDSLKFEFKQE